MILNFSGRLGKSQVYCHVTDSLSQEQRDHFRGQEAAKVAGSRKQGKEGKRSQFRYYLYNFLYNMRRKGIHPTFYWVFGHLFLERFWLYFGYFPQKLWIIITLLGHTLATIFLSILALYLYNFLMCTSNMRRKGIHPTFSLG